MITDRREKDEEDSELFYYYGVGGCQVRGIVFFLVSPCLRIWVALCGKFVVCRSARL